MCFLKTPKSPKVQSPKVQNHPSRFICKIRVKNKGQKRWFIAQLFVLTLKFYYLCIVNKNDGIGAQGNKNLLSGLAKFSACPERKKEVANGDEVSKTTNFY